jgi:hypothetical protein
LHAEEERDADEITIDDIEEAYSDAVGEIIEDYLEDPRGHSALVYESAGTVACGLVDSREYGHSDHDLSVGSEVVDELA